MVYLGGFASIGSGAAGTSMGTEAEQTASLNSPLFIPKRPANAAIAIPAMNEMIFFLLRKYCITLLPSSFAINDIYTPLVYVEPKASIRETLGP